MNYVLKAFKDKTNGKVYFAGDAYDGERTEELIGLGYVQDDKPKKKTRAKKTTE
ncbi:hypothetical protein PQF09_gp10 [Streptococcus phage SW14]|uniref:Uncharacterized protein n=1 Tax=Streptococcus phage SW14 TaxID=2419634 RepID=A0A3S5H1C4_9CAUD|nr:hypothetical protein PQF09_gp10 [Streptococcus phage SW14]AYP29544.1 hypothetical protein SW14_010 [Streptococcus phage SW14]